MKVSKFLLVCNSILVISLCFIFFLCAFTPKAEMKAIRLCGDSKYELGLIYRKIWPLSR